MKRIRLRPVVPQGPRSIYSMPVWTEWDYLVREVPIEEAYDALHKMGEACWELVSALSVNIGRLYFIFKRPSGQQDE